MLHIAGLLVCILRSSSFVICVFCFLESAVLIVTFSSLQQIRMLSVSVHALLYLPCKIFITVGKLMSCYDITYLTVTLLFPDIVICL